LSAPDYLRSYADFPSKIIMTAFHHADHEPSFLKPRNLLARSGPIPHVRIEDMIQNVAPLVRRVAVPTSSDSIYSAPTTTETCGPKDSTGACEKYTSATDQTTIPVVLGVVLPLSVALVIFIILHRRHVKKLRQEDADDRNKALDFGMDEAVLAANKPEMTFENANGVIRQERGLSLDLNLANPYLLPPGLQQSRESLHSLSRSINNDDDKYRPATTFTPNDGYPSSSRKPRDDSSSFTGSSRRRFEAGESSRVLLKNAQRMSRSSPPRSGSVRSAAGGSPDPDNSRKILAPITNSSLAPVLADSVQPIATVAKVTTSSSPSANELRPPQAAVIKGDAENRPSIHAKDTGFQSGHLNILQEQSRGSMVEPNSERQPRLPQLSFMGSQGSEQDLRAPDTRLNGYQEAQLPAATPTPTSQWSAAPAPSIAPLHHYDDTQQEEEDMYDDDDYYYEDDLEYDTRRLTMGMRPLPPDDPSETPEQTAIRIRSFYKEYFDESKTPNQHQNIEYFDGSENYVDDYYSDPYFDPMPQPLRGKRSYAGSERHRATFSEGSFVSGPRAYSSASGQWDQGRQAPPKKRLPAPKPLQVLPTPHKLKDDIILPIDFAPPASYKERQAGTRDSLLGGSRPYSPGLKGANPLVSSFDDLAVMPSP
jgi:hypothetical protein